METHDLEFISSGFVHVMDGPLSRAEAVHIVKAGIQTGKMTHGFHSHDAWELFCPIHASLKFLALGIPPMTIPPGHLLIVPPGSLHMSVELLSQSGKLKLLVMNLPGTEAPWGGLSIRDRKKNFRTALSAEEFVSWTARGGATPATVMEQVAQALGEGHWGRERALGQLRILIAACAEVVTQPPQSRPSPGARQVAAAQLFLQSNYYEPTLTIQTVAKSLGISASHLSTLFKTTTGQTLHKTLIDVRLRRARALLTGSTYSIKEIAALTGWSNQLYFSAAHRQRYGHPPSAVRQ